VITSVDENFGGGGGEEGVALGVEKLGEDEGMEEKVRGWVCRGRMGGGVS